MVVLALEQIQTNQVPTGVDQAAANANQGGNEESQHVQSGEFR
jgi:hypothetical protein